MPTRAPRACPITGCGGIAGRCPKHDALRAQRTHTVKTAARGYDSPWRRLVEQAKAAQRRECGRAWCVDCGLTEEQAKAVGNPLTGDHLRWPALTVEDVAVCCRRCNSIRGKRRSGTAGAVT